MGADAILEAARKMSEPKVPTDKVPVQDETEEETSQDETKSEEPKYTVKVNGEEIEATLEELKLGYMREKDYRQKTQKVSEKNKDLEAKISALDEKIEDATALVELDLDYLESDEGKQLRQEDPEKYLKKVEALQKKADRLKKHKEEKQKRELEKKTEKIKTENQKLQEKISDWLDEDIKARESKEIVEYLVNQGYTSEEIAAIDDHRVFVTARDAVKLQKLMNKDLSGKEDKTPPKSAKPGSTEKKASKTKEEKLRAKLSKSHNMQDAAALLRERIKLK